MLHIDTHTQTLTMNQHSYPVSTSQYGLGEEHNSYKTPRGKFIICEKIGEQAPIYTIFNGRIPIGVWDTLPTPEDLILSRILWLEGVETHNANTKERYIYLHGTNEEHLLGSPASIGCIRMSNTDIIKLFNLVKCGDSVTIE